ncbi:MAG: class I SAM-dependent methyltransferase [Bacteroidales bacterium]|nr:class I SAM-dependent methyltransferase [Bacteroidales bacterium]
MNLFKTHIDKQLFNNSGKNLFSHTPGLFGFLSMPEGLSHTLLRLKKSDEDALINWLTNRVLEEFYDFNQYFHFNDIDKFKLKRIYVKLWEHYRNTGDISVYQATHYKELSSWLFQSNPFALTLYSGNGDLQNKVVCEEYNADFQLGLLHLDLHTIEEPILDIGCGKHGYLVKYLRKLGYKAVGFDRLCDNSEFCYNSDWFDFDFQTERWGTIISNISFSNHFYHHHNRTDGDYLTYAQRFMDILSALKSGGSFYYSPSLPFIESILDPLVFDIKNFNVPNSMYKTSIIYKLP